MTTTEQTPAALTTADVVAAMLRENTGRHMLDSGGAYGRHWERNQTRDLAASPEASLHFSLGRYKDLDVTLSVYHFMVNRLEFAADWQARFDAFAEQPEQRDESWLAVIHSFVDSLTEAGHEVGGIDGGGEPLTVNTYNHESLLSQTLQYVYLTVDDVQLAIVQVHGGCDVRGGYTAPKLFRALGQYSEHDFLDDTRANIFCTECKANWMLDGSTWLYDGGSGRDRTLGDGFPIVTEGEEHEGITIPGPLKGLVVVREDGSASCPCCAKGTLEASPF